MLAPLQVKMKVWRGVIEMKHHINKLVIAVIISFFILQFGKGATEATGTEVSKDLLTLVSRLRGRKHKSR